MAEAEGWEEAALRTTSLWGDGEGVMETEESGSGLGREGSGWRWSGVVDSEAVGTVVGYDCSFSWAERDRVDICWGW